MDSQWHRDSRPSILSIAILILLCMCSCKHQQRTPQDATEQDEAPELPADFIAFYKLFHNDSAFQVDHIVFPLSGMARDTAGRDSAIVWKQENWTLHNAVVPDDFWEVDFTMPLEHIVVEFIHARQGGYWLERRFAKMDTSWYLIYYSDLKDRE